MARRSSAPGSVAKAFRELAGGGNTRGDVAARSPREVQSQKVLQRHSVHNNMT